MGSSIRRSIARLLGAGCFLTGTASAEDSVLDYTWTGISASGEKSSFSYSMAADGKTSLFKQVFDKR